MSDDRILGTQGRQGPFSAGISSLLGMSAEGALLVTPAGGRLVESARQQRVFHASTAQAGVTIIAEMAGTIAANKKTILSIVNPFGSGYDISLLKALLVHVTGTPGAGAFALETFYGVSAAHTVAGNLLTRNSKTGAAGIGVAYSNTAMGTNQPAHVVERIMPTGPFARALDGLAPDAAPVVDQVDGAIFLPPGSACSIAASATGTSHIVAASFEWEEIPWVSGVKGSVGG